MSATATVPGTATLRLRERSPVPGPAVTWPTRLVLRLRLPVLLRLPRRRQPRPQSHLLPFLHSRPHPLPRSHLLPPLHHLRPLLPLLPHSHPQSQTDFPWSIPCTTDISVQ